MTTSDEGIREIQLNGKQLVFLFMAVTVVSVVIFLCGVLVGRGVQRRTTLVDAPAIGTGGDDASLATDASGTAPTPSGPTTATDLSFPKQLDSTQRPTEKLEPKRPAPAAAPAAASAAAAPAPPPATTAAAKTPASAPAPPVAKAVTPPAPPAAPAVAAAESTKPSAGVPAEPRGSGFAIQVAALRDKGEAETLVKRLVGKGYAAFVMPPVSGQPNFRVRVGKFPERADAERVASRLEREEQFKPWITR